MPSKKIVFIVRLVKNKDCGGAITKFIDEDLGTFNGVVGISVLIIIIGLVDILAGFMLCCHPDRQFITGRKDLLEAGLVKSTVSQPLNASIAPPAKTQ
jgi:hypothetical protein